MTQLSSYEVFDLRVGTASLLSLACFGRERHRASTRGVSTLLKSVDSLRATSTHLLSETGLSYDFAKPNAREHSFNMSETELCPFRETRVLRDRSLSFSLVSCATSAFSPNPYLLGAEGVAEAAWRNASVYAHIFVIPQRPLKIPLGFESEWRLVSWREDDARVL